MIGVGLLLVAVLVAAPPRAQSIGVCYGRYGDHLPEPSEVVALCNANNIDRIRLYSPNHAVLQTLRNSGIQVLVDVPPQDLPYLASNSSAAAEWVQNNITAFWPSVAFRYIAVGNAVTPGDSDLWNYVLPAMRNIQTALSSAGGLLHPIKVSCTISADLFYSSSPPSTGNFSGNVTELLLPVVEFLISNDAPILLKVWPYFTYTGHPDQISLSYALFNSSGVAVQDGQFSYWNLFDAMVDSAYAAMKNWTGSSAPIVVSESGWPSAGGTAATIDNARTYNQNLIKHVGSGVGTPRRPGREIEAYIFAMFNENLKPGPETERHLGLFYPDMQPVYPLNFGDSSESIVAGDIRVTVNIDFPF